MTARQSSSSHPTPPGDRNVAFLAAASEQSPEHRSAERQNAAAPSDTASPEDSAEPAEPEESPEVAARHCELFCALCTKRHALLRELFVMFGRARPPGRAAVLRNAEGLARVLGLSAPALLALIEDVPAGSEALLLKMLYFLTEEQPPSQVSPPPSTLSCRVQKCGVWFVVVWIVAVTSPQPGSQID